MPSSQRAIFHSLTLLSGFFQNWILSFYFHLCLVVQFCFCFCRFFSFVFLLCVEVLLCHNQSITKSAHRTGEFVQETAESSKGLSGSPRHFLKQQWRPEQVGARVPSAPTVDQCQTAWPEPTLFTQYTDKAVIYLHHSFPNVRCDVQSSLSVYVVSTFLDDTPTVWRITMSAISTQPR